MDAITLLKNDHKTVEKLFKRFEKAGENAFVEKRAIVDRIIEELSVHAAIEEQVFYPVARATVPETEDVALESLEEHHIVKWVLSELERMPAQHEHFDAKVTVLIENVRHHVDEEESDFFPKVRDELGRNALQDLGEALANARRLAPTHPHPNAPSEPPANVVVGTAAGVADRIGDTVSGIAQGSVTAVNDVIATVLRRKRPVSAPTGSRAARAAATSTRAEVAEATQAVIDTANEGRRKAESAVNETKRRASRTGSNATKAAKSTTRAASRGATKTAKAARSGAKGTATAARTSAKNAKSTAKRSATTTGRTARSAARQTTATAKRGGRKTAAAARGTRRAA